jgi:hypothetical protein
MTTQSGVSGRHHRSELEWRALLARFPASGLTVTEFCRRERVSTASFFRWPNLGCGSVATPPPTGTTVPAFLDLGVLSTASSPAPAADRRELTLDLGAGMTLHLVRG